jgi:hypothetical protein
VLATRVEIAGVEVDLLLRKGRRLVLLEVKTRRGPRSPRPEESIRPAQRARLLRAMRALRHDGAGACEELPPRALPRRIESIELWLAACHLGPRPESPHELHFFRCAPADPSGS